VPNLRVLRTQAVTITSSGKIKPRKRNPQDAVEQAVDKTPVGPLLNALDFSKKRKPRKAKKRRAATKRKNRAPKRKAATKRKNTRRPRKTSKARKARKNTKRTVARKAARKRVNRKPKSKAKRVRKRNSGGFGSGYRVEPNHGTFSTLGQAKAAAKNLKHQHEMYGDSETVTVVSNHSDKVVASYRPKLKKG
jgi:hypothetical protein